MAEKLVNVMAELKKRKDEAEAMATELTARKDEAKAMATEITAGKAEIKAMLEQETRDKVLANQLAMAAPSAVTKQYNELRKLTRKITNHACCKGTACTDLNCPHGEPNLAQIAEKDETEKAARVKAQAWLEEEIKKRESEAKEDAEIENVRQKYEDLVSRKKEKSRKQAKPSEAVTTPSSNNKTEEGEKENKESADANPNLTVPATVATDKMAPNEEKAETSGNEPESDAMEMGGDSD